MKIECLIFDCDGLMFDTERHACNTWRRILKAHDTPIPDGFFEAIIGAGSHQFQKVMQAHPEIQQWFPEIQQQRRPDLQKAIMTLGNVNKPGLISLLQYLKTTSLKVAVASSSPQEYVRWMLSTIGYDFDFDAILGGDLVAQAKPNPEIFLTAASLCGIQPENCLVLEDSKNGHLAAKAAGMHRVFIQDLVIPDQEMKEELIEFQCSSLNQVIDLLQSLKV